MIPPIRKVSATATAKAKATATATATAAAASAATSTVTAAVYSQGFLRLLGTFSHHAWAELVLSSQLSLGHGKADDLYHNPRACCAHSDDSLTNLFRISFGLTLGAPARGGAANRGGGPPWEKYSPQTDPTCTRAWNQTTCTHAHRTKQPAHAHGTKQPCGLIRPLKGCLKAFFRRAFTDGCL